MTDQCPVILTLSQTRCLLRAGHDGDHKGRFGDPGPTQEQRGVSDEEIVRLVYGNRLRYFEGGDGCHIEIEGTRHPHFYGNVPASAWKKVYDWTMEDVNE